MKTGKTLGALILLSLLVTTLSLPAISAPAVAPSQAEAMDKVETLVLEELAAEGQTEYFVWMAEKADLSPAYKLPTKLEKGQFVFDTLRETAARTQKDLRRFLDKQGVEYRPFYIANKILVRNGDTETLASVAARPDVAEITANHVLQMQEPFIDPQVEKSTEAIESNITFINADDVWALGVNGAGTVMAGNDTGLDWDHPALINQYRGWDGTTVDHNYNWWDATGTYPTVPGDGHGHGTHTTGTMVGDDGGANQIGVAPAAQTVHCKNMTDGGSGDDGTFSECFEWDLAPWDLNGLNPDPALAPDAINNSWRYWGGGQPQFKDEIQALHAAGILVEVSAGNEGSSCGTLGSPSDYEEVLTTGSVNHVPAYPGTITGFSSRGPGLVDPGAWIPDVMAPGEDIRSSVPGGGYQGGWSGTSMSGPHATALVGLMWNACPSLTGQVEQTMQMIIDTAVPLTGQNGSNCGGDYTTGPNYDWGHGTIDALGAVQLAIAQCTGTGTLNGTVRDAGTSAPIEGVSIVADWEGGYSWSTTTDAGGYYELSVPVGLYDVSAEVFAYLPATVPGVEVFEDTTTTVDFDLAPAPAHEVSGTVTDAVTGAALAAEIAVLDTPLAPVSTNPGTGFYSIMVPEGTYTFRATAALHLPEEREVIVDHSQTQDFALAPLPCILLVDDDGDNPDVRTYYTEALDALGLDYNVYDVASQGEPGEVDVMGYKMVFWFTGYPYGDVTFLPENEAVISAYLDAGGRFFLSSQDYLYDFGLTSFGQNYLHIASFNSDVSQTIVTGENVFAGLGPYTLSYPFTNYSDTVEPDAQAQVAFAGNMGNAGISFENGTFNTVFFGFPFEAIPDLTGRADVLGTIVEWFGGCEQPPEDTMHVQRIEMRYRDLGDSRYVVFAMMRILDQDGTRLPEATVSGQWTLPNGATPSQEADTNPMGVARFRVRSRMTGTYEFCVTDVTKAGYVYDPSQNGETCDTITFP